MMSAMTALALHGEPDPAYEKDKRKPRVYHVASENNFRSHGDADGTKVVG